MKIIIIIPIKERITSPMEILVNTMIIWFANDQNERKTLMDDSWMMNSFSLSILLYSVK